MMLLTDYTVLIWIKHYFFYIFVDYGLNVWVEIELLFLIAVVVSQRTLKLDSPTIISACVIMPAIVSSTETNLFGTQIRDSFFNMLVRGFFESNVKW